MFEEKETLDWGNWEGLMVVNAFHTIQWILEDPSFLHSFAQFTKDVIVNHCEPGIGQCFKPGPQIVMVQLQLAFAQLFIRIPVA